jgi:hypothetical protein
MARLRIVSIGILFGILGATALAAADLSVYRGLQFGMTLAAAAKQAGTNANDVRLIHKRPALIQEIDWRPRPPVVLSDPFRTDTVQQAHLSFINGELYRIVVDYDRYRIEGMTAADMIAGISAVYGTATTPAAEIAYSSAYGETVPVLARWEDSEYSWNLIRTGDRSSFALIVYSKKLDALAQAASIEAVRLDAREAPQRELALQKQHDDDEQVALEKARSLNKPAFHP